MSSTSALGPLLVYGPRSLGYDFGPGHPLTPLRFGPGIDLLRSVGADPGLAPSRASDEALALVHMPAYIEAVRGFSADPSRPAAMGIGLSDNPAFAGMHEAAATVAGGSVAAVQAILRGEAEHAFHPGGGLHHAMASMAWGFCIYNDVALAIARARMDGLRVLYVDLDVHHGDGVQAAFLSDPGALTLSIHETGRYLFPQTGFVDELGEGAATATSVNLPLEPYTGEEAWLTAVRSLVPTLAAVFGPDLVVSQHGADSHAWDPLAHLRVTTTAMAEAARIVDAVAHRWSGGRWLATGGGGYDVYRVVPRAWALTWLAGAHREIPDATPSAWRSRWEVAAGAFGTPGMPPAFLDAPNAGMPVSPAQQAADERSKATLVRVRAAVLPRLVREAEDRGWWRPGFDPANVPTGGDRGGSGGLVRVTGMNPRPPGGASPDPRSSAGASPDPRSSAGASPDPRSSAGASPDARRTPTVRRLVVGDLDHLRLAARTVSPFDVTEARSLLAAAIGEGARVVVAVAGDVVVGVAVAAPPVGGRAAVVERAVVAARTVVAESLLAVGVAPAWRGEGLGRALLRMLVETRPAGSAMVAAIGAAERDVVEPVDVATRRAMARRLLEGAGFVVQAPSSDLARDDRSAIAGRLGPR